MAKAVQRHPPGAGTLPQRLRLIAGLILFAFAATHFLNHALGNVSLDWMQRGQDMRYAVTHSLPGTLLLYAALPVHVLLSLWKFARRRTWHMPAWEAAQILLGLAIPWFMVKHIMATRGAETLFDSMIDYRHELSVLWPGDAVLQSLFLVIVWLHGCIGVHYWLRLKAWYAPCRTPLFALAIAIPLLALTGWISAARRLVLEGQVKLNVTPEQKVELLALTETGRMLFYGLLAAAVLLFVARKLLALTRPSITIRYLGEKAVKARPGPTLLEISRMKRVPHMSVCGGRARCSTCRTLIVAGADGLPRPDPAELQVLKRIHAGSDVRLACQVRPCGDLVVRPLLASGASLPKDAIHDRYRWGTEQPVAVMFVDLRGFTALSEGRLPFDVVFILNRYVDSVVRVIRRHDGVIDKVMGDGIMALYGIESDLAAASRAALRTIVDLGAELHLINRDLADQIGAPLRIAVGLHGGPAILGRIGLDGRNGVASGLTALGDVVNVASRLEGVAKEQNALAAISLDIVNAAGLDRDALAPLCQVSIRGRTAPLDVACPPDVDILRSAMETSRAG
ncbi:adenylate/guanylate cyclase domain-containing protein [Polymorphum gilvum]|uniref:Putative adenylate cyclase transmembrane protein n=1 Tax=Polymorphum gilvum (strain LMG 25793 / CGMCC 1.9160 / SL003B-26A1) TaxID=991905 RepID=F2IVU7_POLGS|nr:adenylate/guanylate cyclase domain-containing protein [Polymorphum gilvum]ADZ69204.1 Putative adenylate cyclase transmembrane protein [Polymorphum gilvum SL003B-26A1]